MKNEKYYEHSHPLRELGIGGSVQIENQAGPYPGRWAKTGRVVEALDNTIYALTGATG